MVLVALEQALQALAGVIDPSKGLDVSAASFDTAV